MSEDNTLYYLRSILRQLQSVRGMIDHGPSLGGEVLADNIDWLDCFIDSLERQSEWRPADEIPPVPKRQEGYFLVCVERWRGESGKRYVFGASYLNEFPLYPEDGCPHIEEHEDGCPETGWRMERERDDETTLYEHLWMDQSDVFVGWRKFPEPPATPVPPTSDEGATK